MNTTFAIEQGNEHQECRKCVICVSCLAEGLLLTSQNELRFMKSSAAFFFYRHYLYFQNCCVSMKAQYVSQLVSIIHFQLQYLILVIFGTLQKRNKIED